MADSEIFGGTSALIEIKNPSVYFKGMASNVSHISDVEITRIQHRKSHSKINVGGMNDNF